MDSRADYRGSWEPDLRTRLAGLGLTPTREAEIIEELSQHLDDRCREFHAGRDERRGRTPSRFV